MARESGSLDDVLPAYDVSEYHDVFVRVPPAAAYRAMEQMRLSDSWIVSALTRIRGLRASKRTFAQNVRSQFIVLKDDPGREVVFGIVGQFWRLRGNLCDIDPDGFASFRQSGFARSAWNFVFTEERGGTRISTETRVQCFGTSSRVKFRAYWTLIGPFSGLIRKEMLRLIKRRAEHDPHQPP
jgi:hypothetical protein